MLKSFLATAVIGLGSAAAVAGETNNILLTGYWPPTNEMLRKWSPNPAQNPAGWAGRNWRGRGFDIHAHFPEFPQGLGKGVGDFEVDYQDTSADWARIIAEVRPVAIITFSRANTTRGWEIEPAAQRWRLSGEPQPPGRTVDLYTPDYVPETRPVDVPAAMEPVGFIRESTLPMQAIVDAVRSQMTFQQVDAFIQTYNPDNPAAYDFGGPFLSGFISYLGCWHRAENSGPEAPYRCVSAGHIHVGMNMVLVNAIQATEITLETLIAHLEAQGVTPCRADWNDDAAVSVQDIFDFLQAYFADQGDYNTDGGTSVQDIFAFLSDYFTPCP